MATSPTKVIVVGAGFSGIATACMLKSKYDCHDFTVYERDDFYGGTWYANSYPGCGVDIPSIFYSLSFAMNPDFSKVFPDQPEILEYIKSVAKSYDVEKHIQLNIEWIDATWSDKTSTWTCSFRSRKTGESFTRECNVLISGAGGLVEPNKLDIPGAENFKGKIIHSAKWDHSVDLKGKDVCMIGNGCSATQIVPAIIKDVKQLNQFIRTPQYYFPRINPTVPGWVKWVFRYVPGVQRSLRYALFIYLETTFSQFHLTPAANRAREWFRNTSVDFIKKKAPEKYWPLLTPTYAVGCKRRIFDPGYIKSLHASNMYLTNDPVDHFTETSVVTTSGTLFPCDIFVAANGFLPCHFEMPVHGRDGKTMQAHWSEMGGVEAYKSVALAGFPNFFFIFGPNAATGHTSAVYSIENAVDLALRMAEPVIMPIGKEEALSVEVKREAEVDYSDRLQAALKKRVWADNCKGWYVDKNGWNFTVYPWTQWHLWFVSRFPFKGDWSYRRTQEQERRIKARKTRRAVGFAVLATAAAVGYRSYTSR